MRTILHWENKMNILPEVAPYGLRQVLIRCFRIARWFANGGSKYERLRQFDNAFEMAVQIQYHRISWVEKLVVHIVDHHRHKS